MVIWEHIVLPLLAVVALGVADHRARKGLSEWLVNLGWDSCVLALGAAPAIFLSKNASELCGDSVKATFWGFAFVLASIAIAGLLLGKLRSLDVKHVGHAFVALMVGGALIGALVFVATRPIPKSENAPPGQALSDGHER